MPTCGRQTGSLSYRITRSGKIEFLSFLYHKAEGLVGEFVLFFGGSVSGEKNDLKSNIIAALRFLCHASGSLHGGKEILRRGYWQIGPLSGIISYVSRSASKEQTSHLQKEKTKEAAAVLSAGLGKRYTEQQGRERAMQDLGIECSVKTCRSWIRAFFRLTSGQRPVCRRDEK